jgi:phospholipase C
MPLDQVEHIVIVLLENRSFDHLLGYLELGGKPVNGIPADAQARERWANRYNGGDYRLTALDASVQAIDDPPHDREPIAIQIGTPTAGGAPQMGGFVASYATRATPPSDLGRVMGYYDARAVPTYDFLAREFAICSRWHASLPSGTQANRLMAMAGESAIDDNVSSALPEQRLVYDWLNDRGVPWAVYAHGLFPFFALMPSWSVPMANSMVLSHLGNDGHFRHFGRLAQDWQSGGTVPGVIFVEPEYTDGPHTAPNDDHAPTGISAGQAFVAQIYNILISNPARWQKTVMIVTYDEHGGFFDHVPPLQIAAGAGGRPFASTGVRVPALVVSPLVPRGEVFNIPLDHTSILQLIADKFDHVASYSPAVTARQAALGRLSTCLLDTPRGGDPLAADAGATPVSGAAVPAGGSAQTGPASSPARSAQQPPASQAGPDLRPAPVMTDTAQAFHTLALKLADDHPTLLHSPAYEPLARYAQLYRGH